MLNKDLNGYSVRGRAARAAYDGDSRVDEDVVLAAQRGNNDELFPGDLDAPGREVKKREE
ncbi:MAG: hypothetical protein KKF56_04490 [Nanoarchaeota archaeon]|nr:hypothetical protein [Nanoarchaeota archaeon]